MIHDQYSTATMTKTVSGTKLAVATLVMFVAGGAALATAPSTKSMVVSTRTMATIESSCSGDTIYLSNSCAKSYNSFTATCHDGQRFVQTLHTCKTQPTIVAEAQALCAGRRNARSGKVGLNGFGMGAACETLYRTASSSMARVTHATNCRTPEALVEEIDNASTCVPVAEPIVIGMPLPTGTPFSYRTEEDIEYVQISVYNPNSFDVDIKKINLFVNVKTGSHVPTSTRVSRYDLPISASVNSTTIASYLITNDMWIFTRETVFCPPTVCTMGDDWRSYITNFSDSDVNDFVVPANTARILSVSVNRTVDDLRHVVSPSYFSYGIIEPFEWENMSTGDSYNQVVLYEDRESVDYQSSSGMGHSW